MIITLAAGLQTRPPRSPTTRTCTAGTWTSSRIESPLSTETRTSGVNSLKSFSFLGWGANPEAVFLVVCDPAMNEV
jgi:hypothetical protein